MSRLSGWGGVLVSVFGMTVAGCGGGTMNPPPPPGPPPPPPPPATTLNMGLGDVVILDAAAELRAFRLAGGGQSRDYEVAVQSVSVVPGASANMRLTVRAEGASANVTPTRVPDASARPLSDRELRMRAASFQRELELRESARREALRVGARPVRPGLDVSASIAGGSPPALGQMLSFTLGIDSNFNADCNSNTTIQGEVVYAGQFFTIVEDVQLTGHFTPQDYQSIGTQLDQVIYPTNVAYFGDPADIDGNGTVIALITAEVNKFTPPGSQGIIAGFFYANDLFTKASCAASNEGEIFYLVGPDPDTGGGNGQFGPAISLDFANTLARTTVAHEFLHLLNTEQRIVIGGGGLFDREEAWLDEGLAHLAEEVAGFAAAGKGTRANVDLDAVTITQSDLDAYNDFHLLNHDRFGRFLQGGCQPTDPDGPAAAPALGSTGGQDPAGSDTFLMRGFAYGFVRWLGDHFGPNGSGVVPGSKEEDLFRELSVGGPTLLSGVANIERAVQVVGGSSMQWEELVSLYLASLVVDDNAPAGIDVRTQHLTWDWRDVYQQLSVSNIGDDCPFNRTYPLVPANVTLSSSTNQTLNFTVNSSTARFLSFRGVVGGTDFTVELTDAEGQSLAAAVRPQITIVRTR